MLVVLQITIDFACSWFSLWAYGVGEMVEGSDSTLIPALVKKMGFGKQGTPSQLATRLTTSR